MEFNKLTSKQDIKYVIKNLHIMLESLYQTKKEKEVIR